MKPIRDVVLPETPPATITPREDNPAYHRLGILDRYRENENGCWEWLGARRSGYGRCKVGDQTVAAHRVFYTHHAGPIPAGLDLHHKCENRGCVNPAHLEPVTRAVNTRLGAHTKLTQAQADEIRDVVDDLCERFGVRPRTLAAIGERQIWKP